MKQNIIAYTEPGFQPGYVSINKLDSGDVEVIVRASPFDGQFGKTVSMVIPQGDAAAKMLSANAPQFECKNV